MELKDYLTSCDKGQREDFATRCRTTVAYLYQIAGGHRKASHVLAARMADESAGEVTRHELRPDIYPTPHPDPERRKVGA